MDTSLKLVLAAGLAGSLAACSPAAEEATAPDEAVEPAPADSAVATEEAATEVEDAIEVEEAAVEEEAADEAPPGTDIHIYALNWADGVPSLGDRIGGVTGPGYHNQPSFSDNDRTMLYSASTGTDTDIFFLDMTTGESTNVTNTPLESEYSPRNLPDPSGISYLHQAEGGYGGQVYASDFEGLGAAPLFEYGPLGYYAISRSPGEAVVFALGEESNTLQHVIFGRFRADDVITLIADNPGRALAPAMTGADSAFYTQSREDGGFTIYNFSFDDNTSQEIMDLPGLSQDFAQVRARDDVSGDYGFFAADSGVLYYAIPGNDWVAVAELDLEGVTRLAVEYSRARIAIVSTEAAE
jgi:hypothetical protein